SSYSNHSCGEGTMGAAGGDVKHLLSLHGARRPTFGTVLGVGLLVADAPELDDGARQGASASRRTASPLTRTANTFPNRASSCFMRPSYQLPSGRGKVTIVYSANGSCGFLETAASDKWRLRHPDEATAPPGRPLRR